MTTQTSSTQEDKSSERTWRSRAEFALWASVVFVAFVAVGVVVIASARLFEIETWVRFFAVLTIVAVFPISYAAYQRLRSEAVIKRLETEFKLLGYDDQTLPGLQGSVSVSELYSTVYNHVQYILFIGLIIIVSLFILMAAAPHVEPTMGLPIHFSQSAADSPSAINPTGESATGSTAGITSTQTTTGNAAISMTGGVIPGSQQNRSVANGAQPTQSTPITLMLIAYLGAYVYSVQELIRRYNTFDLQPQVYSSIFVRMVVAVILVFVGSSAIVAFGPTAGEGAPEPTAGYASIWAPGIIAFIIGVFPSRGLRWFSDLAERAMGSSNEGGAELPIQNIQGMSTWHASRLQQMGIDDAQNLANSDIRRLLLTTPFDAKIIISWVDQAILYTKVGDKIGRFHAAEIKSFFELQKRLARLTPLPGQGGNDQDAGQPGNGQGQPGNALLLLAKSVGMDDADALMSLANDANYPNSQHIAFYYNNVGPMVWHQATEALRDMLIGQIKAIKAGLMESGEIDDRIRMTIEKSRNPELLIALGEAYYERGIQAIRSGDVQTGVGILLKAQQEFEAVLEGDPNSAEAHFSLALCHIVQGKYQEAIEACNRAIRFNPGYAQAFNNRGLAYLHMGEPQYPYAKLDFNEAAHLDERFSEVYYNRGMLHLRLGEFSDAHADFERAYWIGYDDAAVRIGMANALMGLGRYGEAVVEYTRVISTAPSEVNAYIGRSKAYHQQGAAYYSLARQDLLRALARDDSAVVACYNLAGDLLARGEVDEVRQLYQLIVDHDPQLRSAEAREAKVWLIANS